ncbi:MAG: hypothetical protein IJ572_03110 [Bacilli bacterium]|nr:hypothetical protein [Bacilli bacterium]
MEGFQIFLANNYIWFIVLDIVLLLAIVGYKTDMKNKQQLEKTENLETFKVNSEEDELEQLKAKMGDKANASLNSAVKKDIDVDKEEEVEQL